jgi:hypothetical protein
MQLWQYVFETNETTWILDSILFEQLLQQKVEWERLESRIYFEKSWVLIYSVLRSSASLGTLALLILVSSVEILCTTLAVLFSLSRPTFPHLNNGRCVY